MIVVKITSENTKESFYNLKIQTIDNNGEFLLSWLDLKILRDEIVKITK